MTRSGTPAHLVVARAGAIATVTINRPAVLNALNAATIDELHDTLRALREDESVRAVVITGAGDRAFVAGADITELSELTPSAAHVYARRGQAVMDSIEALGKPVVAAINGFALGGGCELAMACTLRIAGESARLGQPEIKLGLIPGYGGTQRLVRLVGTARALELLLTGEPLSAAEAYRIGLVTKVVPDGEVLREAGRVAALLAERAPLAVRYVLDAVYRGRQLPLEEAQALEAALFGLTAASEDMREGTAAFLQKRTPVFRGK